MEHADKQQVERDVDDGGNDQIIQRMTAVADSLQDSHADVVQHKGHCAEEVCAEIGDRQRKHRFGRLSV